MKFIKKKTFYINVCKECNKMFIGRKDSKFCCNKHSNKKENHNMYNKTHSRIHKENISKSLKNYYIHNDSKNIGRYPTEETKQKMRDSHKESRCHLWKGGYNKKNIPIYDTYAPQIEWCEEVRRNKEDSNILEVK